jgi:anti-sigma B factor antagonist
MSMKMEVHEKGSVSVVVISGKLTLGEGTSTLRDTIHVLAEGGSGRILLNMADVTYIDSSGIGELVAAHTAVTNLGGDIKLLNLEKRVHDLLKVTKLYTVFEVFEDEASALRSFAASKAA